MHKRKPQGNCFLVLVVARCGSRTQCPVLWHSLTCEQMSRGGKYSVRTLYPLGDAALYMPLYPLTLYGWRRVRQPSRRWREVEDGDKSPLPEQATLITSPSRVRWDLAPGNMMGSGNLAASLALGPARQLFRVL